MTKEEIIAVAIREAFRCGTEAGEASQRMFEHMQQKENEVRNEEHDQLSMKELSKLVCIYRAEIKSLSDALQEKDAVITELCNTIGELQALQEKKDE